MSAEVVKFPRDIYRVVMRDVTYTTYCFPNTSEKGAEEFAYQLHRDELSIDDRDYELLVSDVDEMAPICVQVKKVGEAQ